MGRKVFHVGPFQPEEIRKNGLLGALSFVKPGHTNVAALLSFVFASYYQNGDPNKDNTILPPTTVRGPTFRNLGNCNTRAFCCNFWKVHYSISKLDLGVD